MIDASCPRSVGNIINRQCEGHPSQARYFCFEPDADTFRLQPRFTRWLAAFLSFYTLRCVLELENQDNPELSSGLVEGVLTLKYFMERVYTAPDAAR